MSAFARPHLALQRPGGSFRRSRARQGARHSVRPEAASGGEGGGGGKAHGGGGGGGGDSSDGVPHPLQPAAVSRPKVSIQ